MEEREDVVEVEDEIDEPEEECGDCEPVERKVIPWWVYAVIPLFGVFTAICGNSVGYDEGYADGYDKAQGHWEFSYPVEPPLTDYYQGYHYEHFCKVDQVGFGSRTFKINCRFELDDNAFEVIKELPGFTAWNRTSRYSATFCIGEAFRPADFMQRLVDHLGKLHEKQ